MFGTGSSLVLDLLDIFSLDTALRSALQRFTGIYIFGLSGMQSLQRGRIGRIQIYD
jgi:hypothetical protein